ncbi:MAG: HD domain-containing protein [Dehalococcoidia bacterium]|nr:HD domain-containing protein [Dehalococcoidia bacterium]
MGWPRRDELLDAFRSHGHELWVVGGALRDELLGVDGGDEDFATDALPDTVEELARGLDAPVTNVGKRFGTIGVLVDGRWTEITTFRGESYDGSGRWPEVRFGASIEEDLARRDFTVNALARDAMSRRMLDLYGGAEDLRAGIIRAVGDPATRFQEDPLRIMRGVRFAAQLGFVIEEHTLAGMQETAEQTLSLSVERVSAELDKLLCAPYPRKGLEYLRESGLLPVLFPELDAMVGCEQNRFHRFDVWGHTVTTVEEIDVREHRRLRRWTALLHDVGKPPVRHEKKDGEWGFYSHETAGADVAREMLERLRVGRQLEHEVTLLVRRHMDRPNIEERRSVRRFMSRAGELWRDLVALKRADNASHTYDDTDYHDALLAACEQVEAEDAEALRAESPLDGNELRAMFDREPGPWIGRIKRELSNRVLDGELAPGDRERAAGDRPGADGAEPAGGNPHR